MSQYPYNNPWGHGHPYPTQAAPPHPPHPLPLPSYGYPNPQPYAGPPVYNQSYRYNVPPPVVEAHHHASQQSFNYNANSIPGLGSGGAVPGATPYNPGFGSNPWPQQQQQQPQPQPSSFPPYDQSQPPYAAYPSHQPYNSQQTQFIPPAAIPSIQHNKPPQQLQAVPHPAPQEVEPIASVEMEEGELSEGQFEDLYGESREPSQPVAGTNTLPPTAAAVAPVSKVIASAYTSQPTSATETPDGGFYGDDENDGEVPPVDPVNENSDRERSKSYSPFFSPAESEDSAAQPAKDVSGAASAPGLHLSASKETNTQTGNKDSQVVAPAQQDSINYLSTFKSVREAKKEAQKAILRLWPLGVKYQNYIEEGFDQQIIKNLFGDLNLDMPKTPETSTDNSPLAEPQKPQSPKSSQIIEAQQIQPVVAASTNSTATMPEKSKGEERKDRIARLLALKAGKGPTTTATTAPKPAAEAPKPDLQQSTPDPQPQNTLSAQPTGQKTKQSDEKNRILQAKIAALQAKAQKTASEKANMGLGQTNTNGAQAQASSQPQVNPLIPGLSISPGPQSSQTNQRKRPVAADFVEYSSATSSTKRPFGQIRKETSLIIDVSDGSDDEEMDMDIGSPDEDAPFYVSRAPPLPRGASIRDFPPLTPVPSQTPPGGQANNRKRNTELTLKEKEIQEIKRKIALAEAKRKAKQSSGGNQTPVQTARTPELVENKLPRLLKKEREALSSPALSDIAPNSASLKLSSAQLDLRGRVVDSSLEEKLSRLQQLREEEARLQAEIEKELAEKRLLAEQVDQSETPSTATPNTNGAVAAPEPEVPESEARAHEAEDASMDVDFTSSPEKPALSIENQPHGDVSMDEGAKSPKQQHEDTAPLPPLEPEAVATNVIASADVAEAEPDHKMTELDGIEKDVEQDAPAIQPESISSESRTADVSPPITEPEQQRNGGNFPTIAPDADQDIDVAKAKQSELSVVGEDPSPESHDDDSARNDETIPMDLESRSSSPEAPRPTIALSETPDARQSSEPMLEQISDVARPREELQEIESEATGEASHEKSSSHDDSTLAPYESPLRYFHAYRFHPDYLKNVSGGLKSLTYTNRIDPNKPICPSELRNEQCPEDCEFQHLKSAEVPENQILLELGSADHVPPDQKNRFIAGLRDLLKAFKTNKVKDFNVIARGIIQYRSEFLGDQSKVLNLDGVSV